MMSSLRLTRVALLLVGIVLVTSGASRWSSYWTNPATTKFGERATLPELKVAPPSPMEQHFAGERQKWLHAWRTAPRGPNGLPLTDVGYLMKDLKRLPLSARVSGNIMEISKFQDGDACYYDAGRQAFMFVTDKTHRNYSLGGDRGREAMPAKEQGAYVIPRSVLPSEATTGTQARQRNVSFFFFDASGKMHGSCRLSEEDTYAIADFKPTVSSPAVAAPTIPMTPQRAAAEAELKQKIEHYEAPEQVKARQDNKRRLLDQATKARGQTDPCEPVFALRDAGKPIPAEVSLAPLTRGCNQQASPKDIAERRAKGCAWIAPVPYVVSAPTGVVDGRFWIGLDQRPSGNQVVFKDFGDLHTQLGRLTAVDIKFGPAKNKQSATPRFSTTVTTVSIDDQAFPAFSDGTAFEHITISFRGERAEANVHFNTARKADLQACRHNPSVTQASEIGDTHLEVAIRQRAGQTAAVPASRTFEQEAPSKPVDIKQKIAANTEARRIESDEFHQQRLKERLARRTPTTTDQPRQPWRGPVARIDVAGDWGIPLSRIRIPNAEHHRTIGVVLRINNGYYEIGLRPNLIDGQFSKQRSAVAISQSAKTSPALVVGDVVWIGPDDAATLSGTWSVLHGPEG